MDMQPLRPATPETRGPLVELLLKVYLDRKTGGGSHQVTIPDPVDALVDLTALFTAYVRETEAAHGGDFQAWLQRVALIAHPDLDDDGAAG
jgi:hypothetical protein